MEFQQITSFSDAYGNFLVDINNTLIEKNLNFITFPWQSFAASDADNDTFERFVPIFYRHYFCLYLT